MANIAGLPNLPPMTGVDYNRMPGLSNPTLPPALSNPAPVLTQDVFKGNSIAPAPPAMANGLPPSPQDVLKTGIGTLSALRDKRNQAFIKKANGIALTSDEEALLKGFDPIPYVASVLDQSGGKISGSDSMLIARLLADRPDINRDAEIRYILQNVNSSQPLDVSRIRTALGLSPGPIPAAPAPAPAPVVPSAQALPPPVAVSPVQQEVQKALPPVLNDLANFSPESVGQFTYRDSGAPLRIAKGQFDTGAADITRSINAERKLGYADLAARGIRGGGLAEFQNELAGKEAGAIGGLRIKSADTLNSLQQQERGQQFNEFAQQKAIALDSYKQQAQAKSDLAKNYMAIAGSDAQIQQGDYKNFLDALDTSYKSYLAQRSLDYERRAANGELTAEEAQAGLKSEAVALSKQRNDFAQALQPEVLNALDKTARAQKISAVASGVSGALSLGLAGAGIGLAVSGGNPLGALFGGAAGLTAGGVAAAASALF